MRTTEMQKLIISVILSFNILPLLFNYIKVEIIRKIFFIFYVNTRTRGIQLKCFYLMVLMI